jgi:hypothetical protein
MQKAIVTGSVTDFFHKKFTPRGKTPTKKIDLTEIPAIYINLNQDMVKNIRTKALLKKLGFKKILRSNATLASREDFSLHKWSDPIYANACVKSFIDAFQKSSAPFMVFEDDIVLLETSIMSITVPDDADVVYLGGSKFGIDSIEEISITNSSLKKYKKTDRKGIFIPTGMLTAHAILVVNSNAQEVILQAFKDNPTTIQDITLARLQLSNVLRFYGVYPPLFRQDDDHHETFDFIDPEDLL